MVMYLCVDKSYLIKFLVTCYTNNLIKLSFSVATSSLLPLYHDLSIYLFIDIYL